MPTESNDDNNPSASFKSANTGIKKKALKTFAVVNYSPNLKLPGLGTECVVCLSEFTPGERLRLPAEMPPWIPCPIVGYDQASSSQPPLPPQATVINMAPLEREDLVTNYRGSVSPS
ncbi:RING-H2 finger protein ATL78 [Bienertia sinuspersici]